MVKCVNLAKPITTPPFSLTSMTPELDLTLRLAKNRKNLGKDKSMTSLIFKKSPGAACLIDDSMLI
jgi:hypothetical protein